jgi:transcriptional regulator with XRE-family HTH domain
MQKSTHTAEYSVLRSELRQLRERAGLSQRELASRLKVPHSWVAKVEMGERRLDLVEFCHLTAACDADPADVFRRYIEVSTGARGRGAIHRRGRKS